MQNVVIALISALSGGAMIKFIDYLTKSSQTRTEFQMTEFKEGSEIRKEYVSEILRLRDIIDKRDKKIEELYNRKII